MSAEDLYTALLQDAEVESPNWDLAGRQANVWKELGISRLHIRLLWLIHFCAPGYLPAGGGYPRGGMNTRQVSRTLEVRIDSFISNKLYFESPIVCV